MKILGIALACVLACLAASPARAALVNGLYEARVPVADQSAAARAAALQQAFNAVLVKVTGNRAAAGSLAGALGSPSQYVQQYRYEQTPADPAAPAAQPSLLLWAKFDAGVVGKALRVAHAPVWGAERPRTLVWLALPDAPGGRMLSAVDGGPLLQALNDAAQQRGIEIAFPQMDGPDHAALGVPDLTGSNLDRIRQASARYHADAVLAGVVTASGGQYAAHWQLLTADKTDSWDTPPGDEATVVVDGVHMAADRFAARYAIAADATDLDGVALEVDGVTSLDAYAKVLAYLTKLTPVRAVQVQRIAQGSVFYSVDVHGSLDNLESALALGGVLAPNAAPAPAAASGAAAAAAAPLRYSYVH